MKNLTLKQLRYVQALAKYGHFGRAAEEVAISQPALSMQIKQLEQSLGAALFERAVKRVKLTSFGELFVERSAAILHAIDELGDLSREASSGQVSSLGLGIIPTVAPYILPSIVGQLTATHPGIKLHVRETQTQNLVHELIAGKIDAAIVALPISEPTLTERPLFEEEFLLVRPSHDQGKPVPDSQSLARMKLLLLEEGHCFRDQALAFCGLQSSLPREGLDGSSLSTLVQMVSAGIGVTLIPEMAVDLETRVGSVTIDRFGKHCPKRTIGMIWRKTNPLSSQLISISETVASAFESKKGGL